MTNGLVITQHDEEEEEEEKEKETKKKKKKKKNVSCISIENGKTKERTIIG